ncbi:hypothetical protein [Rudaeicoccus suwonensis]|nr:hypothetical protein [Rudaeicoccus suwonensis]
MPASSLIFVLIAAIWAAYLLQHWIRRREALATARSVDQFTAAMRVLERRPQLSEGIAQASDSVSDRPSSPLVSVKQPRPSLRAGTVMTADSQHTPEARPAQTVAQNASSATTSAPAEASHVSGARQPTVRSARSGRPAAHSGSPKLRAGALIGSFALLVITGVCTPFGALPLWSVAVAVVLFAGVLIWCHRSAKAARAARSAGRQSQPARQPRPAVRQNRDGRATPVGATGRPAPQAPRTPAADTAPAKASNGPVAAQDPAPAMQRRIADAPFDVTAVDAMRMAPQPDTMSAGTAPAPSDAGSEWQPVAVPRPTYTMKERADRPVPAANVPQQPALSTAAAYQHVANEDLPFDGLALDQDLDDLPPVHQAG